MSPVRLSFSDAQSKVLGRADDRRMEARGQGLHALVHEVLRPLVPCHQRVGGGTVQSGEDIKLMQKIY